MTKTLLPVLLAAAALEAAPALTIYNGGYAVVRDTLSFDLKSGVSRVTYAGATAQVEPDTVILRDVAGKVGFRILEQSYRNDPVSQAMLLSLFEGREVDFLRRKSERGLEDVVGAERGEQGLTGKEELQAPGDLHDRLHRAAARDVAAADDLGADDLVGTLGIAAKEIDLPALEERQQHGLG
ncbi:MAG: hypothetical protein ACKORB_08965, partial [Opitutia bacterium]